MITASEMVSRVTPPMNAPAPISAKAPGSIQAQGLGDKKTPGGALHGMTHQSTLRPLHVHSQRLFDSHC